MPSFDILKKLDAEKTFRVASVMGIFDIQTERVQEHFTGEIPVDDTSWKIGIIFGASGTGKTIIARHLWAKYYTRGFKYRAPSIVDDMPENREVKEICRIFNSVGFSSAPSWLKPYHVLSTGEQMRVDLARAILSDNKLIVFDEFTSTVDRNVARIGSHAIAKAIRRSDKQFIAVSCHKDIIPWLEPDWAFCTDTMRFTKKKSDAHALKWKSMSARQDFGKCLGSITI